MSKVVRGQRAEGEGNARRIYSLEGRSSTLQRDCKTEMEGDMDRDQRRGRGRGGREMRRRVVRQLDLGPACPSPPADGELGTHDELVRPLALSGLLVVDLCIDEGGGTEGDEEG